MINTIQPLILNRRSIFSFSAKKVEKEILDVLFEAAGKAPSSLNAQPWAFIYATKEMPEEYAVMADLLSEGNQRWALSAPVLILSLAEVYSEQRQSENAYAFHDLGMATANLLLQATGMGLFAHPMGGYDKERAKANLHVPDRFKPAAMLALGYPGDNEALPDDLKNRLLNAGNRKSTDVYVREGRWH